MVAAHKPASGSCRCVVVECGKLRKSTNLCRKDMDARREMRLHFILIPVASFLILEHCMVWRRLRSKIYRASGILQHYKVGVVRNCVRRAYFNSSPVQQLTLRNLDIARSLLSYFSRKQYKTGICLLTVVSSCPSRKKQIFMRGHWVFEKKKKFMEDFT